MGLNYFFGRVGWGGWGGWVDGVGGVEKRILKLTSVSTGVGVEARAELDKNNSSLCSCSYM